MSCTPFTRPWAGRDRVQIAWALAGILDESAAAANVLAALLDKLRLVSARSSRGSLAVVNMADVSTS